MIDLVIVGTIGLDDIKTPFGEVKEVLGGSAVYAGLSAALFAKPALVSIIGSDLPPKYLALMKKGGLDIEGISRDKKTFRWSGLYEFDMSEAETLKTELNALAKFNPDVPKKYRRAKFLFLANTDPTVQLKTLNQMENHPLVLTDTMNYWIKHKRKILEKVIARSDIVLLNDGEARQFAGDFNLVKAAKKVLNLGAKHVIVKKGEHGALLFSPKSHFSAPGYPLEQLKDPTGAGDSFAGTLIGYLAKTKTVSERRIRQGIIYASAVASFVVEEFSVDALLKINRQKLKERYEIFKEIRKF